MSKLKKKTVVIAISDKELQKLVTTTLGARVGVESDICILSAVSMQEALGHLESQKVDITIADYPDVEVEALSLHSTVRREERYDEMVFVLLAKFKAVWVASPYVLEHLDIIIKKPFTPIEFIEELEEVLS